MKRLLSVVLLSAAIGCGPSDRDPGNNTGTDAAGSNGGPDSGGGGGGENCSADATFIYTVDDTDQLIKFDPSTKQFSALGTLGCNADLGATPFSMGVDRNATAYILYSSGELFKADTKTPANCTKTAWQSQSGLELFGMGFSTETAGGSSDTLFIAGGVDPFATTQTVASVDVTTMQATVKGQVQGSPELTGTGSAELWGFFPGNTPRVAQIDKATGATTGTTFSLNEISGQPAAWAFAFHGGDFWVFLMRDSDVSTTVYHVDGSTGMIKDQVSAGGRVIVGAGVSTCAPVIL